MEIDLEDVRRIFLEESLEDLSIVEQSLQELERDRDSQEAVATVYRKFHSLRGSAATVGFDRLSAFAHRIEDILARQRGGDGPVDEELLGLLPQVVAALRDAIPSIVAGEDDLPAAYRILEARVVGGPGEGERGRPLGTDKPE